MATDTPAFGASVEPGELDGLFDALSDETRRQILAFVAGCAGPVTFADLVAHLSGATGGPLDRTGPADPDDAAVGLHHVHLPKLEAAGLVDVTEGPTGRIVGGTRLLDDVASGLVDPDDDVEL